MATGLASVVVIAFGADFTSGVGASRRSWLLAVVLRVLELTALRAQLSMRRVPTGPSACRARVLVLGALVPVAMPVGLVPFVALAHLLLFLGAAVHHLLRWACRSTEPVGPMGSGHRCWRRTEVSAGRDHPRGGEGGPGQTEKVGQPFLWWPDAGPKGAEPLVGGVGIPMLTEVASSVVWLLAMVPVAITKVPTVTSPTDAVAPDFEYEVEPETSTVCQKPCSSAMVTAPPLTDCTVPARRGCSMWTLVAAPASEVEGITKTREPTVTSAAVAAVLRSMAKVVDELRV